MESCFLIFLNLDKHTKIIPLY